MTRSVTRTVRLVDPDHASVWGPRGRQDIFALLLLPHPPFPYRVTYTVSTKGGYCVQEDQAIQKRNPTPYSRYYAVCFLPTAWPVGTLLRRSVTPVRGWRK